MLTVYIPCCSCREQMSLEPRLQAQLVKTTVNITTCNVDLKVFGGLHTLVSNISS